MTHSLKPVIEITNGLFKGFKKPIDLCINKNEHWVVLGPKKQYLLEILAGKHTPIPPTALKFPAFGHDSWPSQVISHVVFGQSSIKAPYLSARYESFRDEFDYSLETLLKQKSSNSELIAQVAELLNLSHLKHQWFATLSNGQTRRAHLAMALLKEPEVLIVDEPFLGLDPENRNLLDQILKALPITVIISAQSASAVPDWTTHLAIANEDSVISGRVREVEYVDPKRVETKKRDHKQIASRKPVIELRGITIKYRDTDRPLFDGLELTVKEGERLHIKGPNGSGKSTLLALITADHPKSWNEKVVLFGEPREVGKHSYFDINQQIGSTSPEIHSLFPRHLTLEQTIATGFGEGFIVPKNLTDKQKERIKTLANELEIDLNAEFGESSLSKQKQALFARALVNDPKILILDEAFSTLNRAEITTAFKVLDNYQGAVLVIGHNQEEIPDCDNTLNLSN